MPRPFTPKVVTGNALLEGDVVYLAPDGRWTRDLSQAELLTDTAEAQTRLTGAQERTSEVVGVYLADMTEGPDGPEPTHFREAFRRAGPSACVVRKQAG